MDTPAERASPPELLKRIVPYLCLQGLGRVACVSWGCHDYIEQDFLWESLKQRLLRVCPLAEPFFARRVTVDSERERLKRARTDSNITWGSRHTIRRFFAPFLRCDTLLRAWESTEYPHGSIGWMGECTFWDMTPEAALKHPLKYVLLAWVVDYCRQIQNEWIGQDVQITRIHHSIYSIGLWDGTRPVFEITRSGFPVTGYHRTFSFVAFRRFIKSHFFPYAAPHGTQ